MAHTEVARKKRKRSQSEPDEPQPSKKRKLNPSISTTECKVRAFFKRSEALRAELQDTRRQRDEYKRDMDAYKDAYCALKLSVTSIHFLSNT